MARERLNAPVAITGMHRSGTSMVTRALHDSGLHLIGRDADELIDAAEDNPEGFWENKAIVACNDELLEAAGGSWDNPPAFLAQAVDDPRVAHVSEASIAALAALSEHERWGFKDPRTCLTAGYWLDLRPDLLFVICVRHPLEVALSLKRRNQNSYSLGLALWERYYATVLEIVPPEQRIVTHYDTFFVDPVGEIGRLCAFTGLEPALPRVRTDLRHHNIQVSLNDAGASASLRALYADLCRQAGLALPPELPADEGRVRRLILDGAVAQRHADQRQAAIERLQERENELREHFNERVRELENRHQHEMAVLATRPGPLQRRLRRSAGRAVREGRQYVLTPGRQLIEEMRCQGAGAVHAVGSQLPVPVRFQLRRVRNLVRRGRAEPGTTARAVTRKLAPKLGTAADRLPKPAQQTLRRSEVRLRRARSDPQDTAQRLILRLPPPAQDIARRAGREVVRALRPGPGRVTAERGLQPLSAPKGLALRKWKDAYEQLVQSALPAGTPWLVVMPGSPKKVGDAAPNATTFPHTRQGRPFADDLAHVAHLEALRFGGHRYLVLPEGSRSWFRRQTELRDHVIRTYRTVADREGAGAVFDLSEAAADDARSLTGEVNRLAAGLAYIPAVLDWTALDVERELADFATFRSPDEVRLPYLDHSVDLVVVDADHDLDEARRVANLGVLVVRPGATGVEVVGVEVDDARVAEARGERAGPSASRVVVWSAASTDPNWELQLGARVDAAGAQLHLGAIDARMAAELGANDVVVVVEPGVLPLPGSIEIAAGLAAADPTGAVAGKVLGADGRLEGAGGIVFGDRSVALIAAESLDVRAAWHDYVRPVCWAPGIVAASAALFDKVPGPTALNGRSFLREWCAHVWARGGTVVYQPSVTAVRVTGSGREPTIPLVQSAWQRVLDLRPPRPRELTDGAWRYLIARDDVEACRG